MILLSDDHFIMKLRVMILLSDDHFIMKLRVAT